MSGASVAGLSGLELAGIVVEVFVLLLGGTVTYVSFRTYRRVGSQVFGALAVGFGCITFGVLAGGFSSGPIGVPLAVGVFVGNVAVLVGLGLIAYSLTSTAQATNYSSN